MSFSFKDLNLSGVTAAAGGAVLSSGRYVVKVRDAEVTDTKAGTGKVLKLKLSCDQGVITDNINVFSTTSSEAQRIGREQLKGMLVSSGHPNPDEPGDIKNLIGLTVGIIVGEDGQYNGKPSYKVKGYLKPADIGTVGPAGAPAAAAPAPAIGGAAAGGLPF